VYRGFESLPLRHNLSSKDGVHHLCSHGDEAIFLQKLAPACFALAGSACRGLLPRRRRRERDRPCARRSSDTFHPDARTHTLLVVACEDDDSAVGEQILDVAEAQGERRYNLPRSQAGSGSSRNTTTLAQRRRRGVHPIIQHPTPSHLNEIGSHTSRRRDGRRADRSRSGLTIPEAATLRARGTAP
jgi:hypothetical protein